MRRRIVSIIGKLNQIDPVSSISRKLFWDKPLLTSIGVGALQVSIWWILGNYTITHYPGDIVGPKNLDELSFGLFLWGIFSPVLWWYYLSLPRLWKKAILALCKEEVVECELFQKTVVPKLNNIQFIPSILIAALVLYIYMANSVPTEIALGRLSFWFVTSFGNIAIALYVGCNAYIFVNFALRTLILIMTLRHYFYTNGIKVIHVYHVDKCGGFAPIGNLAMSVASLAVAAGVWATWYALLPVMAGGKMNLSATVILLYLAYAILAPLLLVSLTRPVSLAMKRYKQEVVMKVSRRLQDDLTSLVVNEKGSEKVDAVLSVLQKMEEYQKLNTLYDLLSAMPESPIRTANLKRFTGFAAIPGIVFFLSFFADIFTWMTFLRK